MQKEHSLKSRGLHELMMHFQREQHLWSDQRFRARYHPSKLCGSDGRTLYGTDIEADEDLDVPDLDHNRPFYHDVMKVNRSKIRPKDDEC